MTRQEWNDAQAAIARLQEHLKVAHGTEPHQYFDAARRHENEHANRSFQHPIDDLYRYIEDES